MLWGLKAIFLKCKFYVSIMARFGKNEESGHCRVMVEKK